MRYVLGADGKPQPEPDLMRWAKWFEENNEARRVALDKLESGVIVSTVFLAVDHQWGDGPPILWETMIFRGPHSHTMRRYSSREAAEAGHCELVTLAQEEWNLDALLGPIPARSGDCTE